MSFSNPIVGGQGALVRDSIKSRVYVPGTSGWSINRDGTAEFNGVTINGGELLVSDPDGSYVRVYDQNPGVGAVIEVNPADVVGHTIDDAGQILGFSSVGGASIAMIGPTFDGVSSGSVFIGVEDNGTPESVITMGAVERVDISSLVVRFYDANATPGFEFHPDAIGAQHSRMLVDDRVLGFNVANIHMLTPPAPAGLTSAIPITITGASTTTFVKEHADTQVEVFMSGGGYITAGAGASVTFGILISGGIGDFSIVKGSFSSLSNRLQFSGTRLLSAFAAGSYTITPRWFRSAGTSTIIMDASDASLTVALREVRQA